MGCGSRVSGSDPGAYFGSSEYDFRLKRNIIFGLPEWPLYSLFSIPWVPVKGSQSAISCP